GPAGLDGADGLDGATGPQGPQGPAGTYTAGTGIDITGSVISATGSGAMPEYAYANIGNASVLGAQTLTAVAPAGTYVNGVVMNGSSITLHANKMYEVSVAFYIYNATGGHTFRLKDATNNQYLATELYFGQGGSDISYNISTTSCLIKPTTDINLELEKTQGTDVNLIGKLIVKEIK
ncbi:collagen-like triple helix repeat-containing protein, partial [Flavobacterium sp.]|uniref:collagen-like triple helix repeat-containing protein n=1 Tax=Flavobacterium sp. TaxID=239 RepID=UPI0040473353